MYHHSTGKIIYDPKRPGMRSRTHWWCIVTVDREITRYYRWWIKRHFHIKGLHKPSWDAHISIIRGEKPSPELMHLWKKYNYEDVSFKYRHEPKMVPHRKGGDGHYWVIDVECPRLLEIRKELQRPYHWSTHITVGRTYY